MAKRLMPLFVFGIAFGFVEAAVVVYLRKVIGYTADYSVGSVKVLLNLGFMAFTAPTAQILRDAQLSTIEGFREFATLLMLFSVAWISAKRFKQRLGAFLIAFALWDLFYYLFLHIMVGWPSGFLDIDVFFLLPVPWIGPVITPVVISTILLILGVWLYIREELS